jgi:hypothetical protein
MSAVGVKGVDGMGALRVWFLDDTHTMNCRVLCALLTLVCTCFLFGANAHSACSIQSASVGRTLYVVTFDILKLCAFEIALGIYLKRRMEVALSAVCLFIDPGSNQFLVPRRAMFSFE